MVVLKKFKNFFDKRKKLLIIIAAAIVIAGGLFKIVKGRKKEQQTALVSKQTLKETVSATGQIKAQKESELRFNVPSKVVWLGVKKGDQVNAWQAVASLDKRQLEKNLKKALSEYMTTRWDFEETILDKYKDKVITETIRRDKEKAQFALDRSVYDVEIEDIVLKESVLVSPIAGTVVDIGKLVAGENLTAASLSTNYIKVVDLSSLYFEAEVDEVDFSKIKQNQEAEVVLDSFPQKTFQGTVTFIGKEGIETSGGVINVLVDVSFESYDESLVTGLNGEANFIISQKENVLVISTSYIVLKDGKEIVYVLEEGKKKPQEREVLTGIKTPTQTEVLEGLEEGEKVVLVEEE